MSTVASRRPNRLLRIALVAIILAGLVAVGITAAAGGGNNGTGGGDARTVAFDTSAAAVSGVALPTLPDSGADPAVGHPAPSIQGFDLAGRPQVAPATGRPTVLLFLAHWCPHCQREVPVVQDWVDAGRLPKGVDLVGVATAMTDTRPNWPASAWLDREGWSSPVIADSANQAAAAYNLPAFPYWVVVDAHGNVVQRVTGELTPSQIDGLAKAASGPTRDR